MKRLLLFLALLLAPTAAFAQCNGIFQPNTACGNNGGSPALPFPIPLGAITGLAIGTTPVTGATSGYVLDTVGGILNQIATDGTGNVVLASAITNNLCTNQVLIALSVTGAPTCISITNAYLAAGAFSAITGVGTLTSGTWQATPIGTAYGGLGANNSTATGVVQFVAGTPSISTALANGTTATTQTTGDATTKVATDAFVAAVTSLPSLGIGASQITSGIIAQARLPTATAAGLGIVQPDNSTITISGGIITATGAAATSINAAGPTTATTVSNGNNGAILYMTQNSTTQYLNNNSAFTFNGLNFTSPAIIGAGLPWEELAASATSSANLTNICAGSADIEPALVAAYALSSTVALPVNCNAEMLTNYTVLNGRTLIIPCSSSITPSTGVTLTIQGSFPDPGACQVFGTSHSLPVGSVVGLNHVKPEWWGAYNDATHDDGPAIRAAAASILSAAGEASSQGSPLELIFGCGGSGYYINSLSPGTSAGVQFHIQSTQALHVHGCAGQQESTDLISGPGLAGDNVLQFYGGTTPTNFRIYDLSIFAATYGDGGVGILFGGSAGQEMNSQYAASLMRNVTIYNMSTAGVVFQNAAALHIFASAFMVDHDNEIGLLMQDTPTPDTITTELYLDNVQFPGCSTCAGNVQLEAIAQNGSSAGNITVSALHVNNSYFYPGSGECVLIESNGAAGASVADVWFSKNQFDAQKGSDTCIKTTTPTTGNDIIDVHIDHNYWVSDGTGTPFFFYAPSQTDLRWLWITNNFIQTNNGVSANGAINISGGRSLQVNNNTFIGGSGVAGSKMIWVTGAGASFYIFPGQVSGNVFDSIVGARTSFGVFLDTFTQDITAANNNCDVDCSGGVGSGVKNNGVNNHLSNNFP